MIYGLDVCLSKNLIAAGDALGNIHFIDGRLEKKIATHQVHKKGNKVRFRARNPLQIGI